MMTEPPEPRPSTSSVVALARRSLGPPRTGFHVVMGLIAVGMLWAGSLPGVPFVPLMAMTYLVLAGAALWAVKVTVHTVRRRRGTAPPVGRWYLLAPVGGVVVLALLVSGAAFEARWALSRSSFEQAAAAALGPDASPVGGRIGLYRVLGEPRVVGDAVFFDDPAGGGMFDDAGFAYLPEGLTAEAEASFESLRVERIEGPWFRWWSSW